MRRIFFPIQTINVIHFAEQLNCFDVVSDCCRAYLSISDPFFLSLCKSQNVYKHPNKTSLIHGSIIIARKLGCVAWFCQLNRRHRQSCGPVSSARLRVPADACLCRHSALQKYADLFSTIQDCKIFKYLIHSVVLCIETCPLCIEKSQNVVYCLQEL
jgi:hypothetical protein